MEKIYKATEYEALRNHPAVAQARAQWQVATEEAHKKHGDRGSCILGEGIYVFAVRPRCRKPERMRLISPPTSVQGEVVRLAGMNEAVAFLRAAGIECFGFCGNMD